MIKNMSKTFSHSGKYFDTLLYMKNVYTSDIKIIFGLKK